MASSLLLLLFNVCLFFTFIDLIVSTYDRSNDPLNDIPILQLSVHPNFGYTTENIELRCQITQPSPGYDNIYLTVKTDNVKPSGILLMFAESINQCRGNKLQYIRIETCSSSLIHIHINHTILNDSLHTIDYACIKDDITAVGSYRILKNPTVRYYDPKYSNSSSSLTYTLFFIIIFSLLIARITTVEDVRWLSNK